jgi:hypothetical protein
MPLLQSRASTTLKEALAVTISVVSNSEKALNLLSTLILLQMVLKCSVLQLVKIATVTVWEDIVPVTATVHILPSKKILHKKLIQ